MPTFGNTSAMRLKTCHPDLQQLFNEVIKHIDITIICGHRGQADQDAAFANGSSKLKWPHGRHNSTPSEAVDVMPYPLDWNNLELIREYAVIIKGVAARLDIPVVWGGDWKSFKDMPHWELRRG